jgi:hypothetical protein
VFGVAVLDGGAGRFVFFFEASMLSAGFFFPNPNQFDPGILTLLVLEQPVSVTMAMLVATVQVRSICERFNCMAWKSFPRQAAKAIAAFLLTLIGMVRPTGYPTIRKTMKIGRLSQIDTTMLRRGARW